MIHKFERISRLKVRSSNILDYCVDTLRLPNGKIVKYDTMLHKGAAAVVPVMEDGRILLVRQYRPAIERVTLEIPAGCRDSQVEPFEEAAARELEEETGYHSDHLEKLVTIVTAIAYCNEKIEVFVARDLKKTRQHLDENEFVEVEAFPIEELARRVWKGEIQDSKTVASLMAYYGQVMTQGSP